MSCDFSYYLVIYHANFSYTLRIYRVIFSYTLAIYHATFHPPTKYVLRFFNDLFLLHIIIFSFDFRVAMRCSPTGLFPTAKSLLACCLALALYIYSPYFWHSACARLSLSTMACVSKIILLQS